MPVDDGVDTPESASNRPATLGEHGARACARMRDDGYDRCDELLAAIHDEPVRQIVGRDGYANAIAGEHADVMASHATGELCAHHGAALIHFDRVLAAAERVLDDALHLEKIAFAHGFVVLRKGPLGTSAA